jgi:OOP family OmpA-OmpF porin
MMIKRLVTGTLLSLAAVTANAEHQDSGWLIGAAVSFGDYSLDDFNFDDNAVGGQVSAQYRFNKWFGIEGAYYNSGELEDDFSPQAEGGNAEVEVDGFSLTAVGYLPLGSDDIQAYGKAGFYTFDQNLQIDNEPSQSRKADGLTVGGGFRIAVSDHFSIRTEGNWYDLDDAEFWVVNLGVDYHFGK